MRSILLILVLASLSASARSQDAAAGRDDWKFTVEPYIWLPSLSGQGQTNTSPSVDVNVVGDFDVGLPVAFRAVAPEDRYSISFDGLYARWVDDQGATETKTQLGLIEGGFGYPVAKTCSLEAGLRYLEVDYDVDIGAFSSRAKASFLDPWVGARAEFKLADQWSTSIRGDVGGFGVGSDLSWQALALVAWKPSDNWRFDLGYRAFAADFNDSGLEYDLLAYGPIIGVGWSF
jgi:opacity protein-like surface antigen